MSRLANAGQCRLHAANT